jgi:CubicO group peptidase (beta-lactamase class C family)
MRFIAALLLAFSILLPARAAETQVRPDGWDGNKLERLRAKAQPATGFVIVQDGKVVAAWGDVGRKVNVASVRKSLISALYGIAVADGRIDLASTLAQLGIEDKPPSLTGAEKQATIRDLLMARSGIYHPAAYETRDIKSKRPARGSHAPGTFWFYNNWDFNALGTIYRHETGEDIFESFYRRIARPIGMEDFKPGDGTYVLDPVSIHPAYPFSLSARDAARFGQLMLNGGVWEGRQVVPAAWVKASTTAYSHTPRGNLGYGYLWWVLRPDVFGEGAAMALGYGGQAIAIVPAKRLVVAQTTAPGQNRQFRTSGFVALLRQIVEAAP